MKKRRVVITGIGLATPYGSSLESNFNALLRKQEGFKHHLFGMDEQQSFIGGEIYPIDVRNECNISGKVMRNINEVSQYSIYAVKKALEDAVLSPGTADYNEVGIFIGLEQELRSDEFIDDIAKCSFSEDGEYCFEEIANKKISHFNIMKHLKDYSNFPLAYVSILTGVKGPVQTFCNGANSGGAAIIEAYHLVQNHDTDILLAGASSFPFKRYNNSFYGKKGLVATEEQKGIIFSNGAVFFVLEEMEHAKRRGARIYGEILGGASCTYWKTDDFIDICMEGCENAVEQVLGSSGLTLEDVDFISNFQLSPDRIELKNLSNFKDLSKKPLIVSYQNLSGHFMAASQPFDLAIDLAVINNSVLVGMNKNIEGNFSLSLSLCADIWGNYCSLLVGEFNE